MGEAFKILVADRNRHVREFLRRELIAEGYQVTVARDGRELLVIITGDNPPDVLVLDPEMPYVSELALLERLYKLYPTLPVIIYTFLPEDLRQLKAPCAVAFLEKKEDLELLKKVVVEVIGKYYPQRFKAAQDKQQSFPRTA